MCGLWVDVRNRAGICQTMYGLMYGLVYGLVYGLMYGRCSSKDRIKAQSRRNQGAIKADIAESLGGWREAYGTSGASDWTVTACPVGACG